MTPNVEEQSAVPGLLDLCQKTNNTDDMQTKYNDLFDQSEDTRKENVESIVNSYYDMCTDFYEHGWGQSFHFAPQAKTESFEQAVMRHEHILAQKLDMAKNNGSDKVYLDVGCGVGGPQRAIARFTGAKVIGLNNNEYQIKRAQYHSKVQKLDHLCTYKKGDFMKMPFPDNSFDGVYALEATCHASDLVLVYSEVFRVLKPGGKFCFYEWALTDKFDPENAEHLKIKKDIEIGNGIPVMQTTKTVIKSINAAGFEVVEAVDVVNNDTSCMNPWYATLQGGFSINQFKHSSFGRFLTHTFVTCGEYITLLPKGTKDVHQILLTAADSLVAGGVSEIFTPMYRVEVQKPL